MNKTLDISAFTPSQMSPEDRKGIFVQRHDLLADAVARVKESAETGNKHHLLFVGPRGSGKTLFVSLLVDEVDADPQLAGKLAVAWLNEDETSTTFLDLLLRIYRALSKRYPEVFGEDSMDPVYDLDPGAMEDFAIQIMMERLNKRTPLIVVENLDRIFQGIRDEGQKKLRAFLQEHPVFAIVATAQALIEDLTNRDGPFHGFFQTEHLKPLKIKDATELLAKVAKQKKDTKLATFLNTAKGRARTRALHFLTGGNHRVFIVLAQFITHDTIEDLVKPFLKMVDELTPYYQERVRALPDLQCKIVEYLCTCTETVPVKAIARRMLTSHQSVASQLQDLRAKGYVKSHKKGRESLYEVSEPMMRLCVEVKENQTRTLGLLVDFIRVWFETGELTRRRAKAKAGSLDDIYYSAACERMVADGNLRHRILVDGLKGRIEKAFPERIANDLFATLGHAPEELALAVDCLMNRNKDECLDLLLESGETDDPDVLNYRGQLFGICGETAKAIADYTAAIELKDAPTDRVAEALNNRGMDRGKSGDSERAVTDFTAVVKLKDAPTDEVAKAHYNRGVTHGESGDSEKEIADYTAVVELKGAPIDQVAKALNNRGVTHGQSGDKEKEIADYTAVVELKGAPTYQVAKSLNDRGMAHGQSGDREKEIADYTAVVELKGAPTDQVAKAIYNRGVAHGQSEDREKAIADYTTVVELRGGPTDLVAMALNNRGVIHGQSGDREKEIADYTTVVELKGAPTDQVAMALYNRGVIHGLSGARENAISDFTAVIALKGAPIDLVARSLNNRGIAHGQSGDSEKQIADYTAVVDLKGVPVNLVAMALINRGIAWSRIGQVDPAEHDFRTLLQLEGISTKQASNGHLGLSELQARQGRWDEALEQLNEGLLRGQEAEPRYVGDLGELMDILSRAGVGKAALEAHVERVLEIATEREVLVELGDGLVRHLGELKNSDDPLDPALLERWGGVWVAASEGIPQLEIPMRMFRYGIAYLASKDRDESLLLNLKSEERYLLRQTLGLEADE